MHENEISKKKFSRNNTKILAKNTHWRVETQLSGKFANIGESATEKQSIKKFKPKFFIKSFSSFSNFPHPVKPTLLFAVKTSRLVIQHLTSNRTIDNFICTIQMTNTSAFPTNINENNDCISETFL